MKVKALSLGIIGIIVLIVIIFFAVFLLQSPIGEKVYKIGAIVPLTGPGATLGVPFANGMSLAVEEINQLGGVNSYKVEILFEDSKLEGKASADSANYLLNVENPDVFSVMFHLPAQSVSPILMEARKPVVYEAYTRSILESNPYSFKADFDSLTGCEELIRYAKEKEKYYNLGVLMSRVEYNELCLEGIKKIEPNVKEYWYTFGEKDFRTLLTKANEENVDALVTIGIDFEYINMFKQLTELNYPIKMICAIASECIFPGVIQESSPEVLNGTISIDFVPTNISETEFAEKYSNKYPNPSFTDYAWGAIGYEEIQYITEAMKKCEPGNSDCLTEELKKVKDYKTVINTKGFKNRVLQLTTKIYEFKDNEWRPVK
ncbi:ABC transporter substrate-binding protein [Candidatus Micrarchaeota archaeon]|nr:ABC transporter substrate-binding protein [Candidatus Micrarchaeota archaeon]MBU1930187.1 ABC transporter substrate-binding protein [Candidatus Micrarchaeota archaeon]